jgi:hypothetical protein
MKPSRCTPPPQELSKENQERDSKHPGLVDLISINKKQNKQATFFHR